MDCLGLLLCARRIVLSLSRCFTMCVRALLSSVCLWLSVRCVFMYLYIGECVCGVDARCNVIVLIVVSL